MQENGADRKVAQWVSRVLMLASFAVGFAALLVQSHAGLNAGGGQTVMTLLDAAYGALRLFVLEGPESAASGEYPLSGWALAITRYTAPASLAGVLITLSDSFWRAVVQRGQLGKMRDHTVILGAGRAAQALAQNLARDGERFVIIVSDNASADRLRAQLGNAAPILVRSDDGTTPWSRARTPLARAVFLCSGDHENLSEMKALRSLSGPTKSLVRVFVRLENANLKRELVAREGVFTSTPLMRFEPFSTAEMAARAMFHGHDVFLDGQAAGFDGAHWLCLGWSDRVLALVEHLVRMAPMPGAPRPEVTVLSDQPAAVTSVLQGRFACVSEYVNWKVVQWDNPQVGPSETFLATLFSTNPLTSVIVAETLCAGNAIAVGLEGRMTRKQMRPVPIWLCDPGLASLPGIAATQMQAIPSLGQVMQPAQFLGGLDKVARKFHEAYCQYSGNHSDWEDLDENMRNANRRVADHAKTKMESMGYAGSVLTPRPDLEDRVAKHLEPLARAEHDAWSIDRLLTGWRYGPERSNPDRIHPNLIGYDDLTEAERDLDRGQIRQLLSLF